MADASWNGAPERVDVALPALGLARSRSHAAELIRRGEVLVNGVSVAKTALRVVAGARLEVATPDVYVSRSAYKLVAALDTFSVCARGKIALDIGASTGGFTQVLLERHARRVVAVDVGHGQLAASIRADARVRVAEGCNARYLTAAQLRQYSGDSALPQLVVCDVSFISVALVLPALVRVAAAEADVVVLIKPQFEVGRQGIRGGIVTDSQVAAAAVARVIAAAARELRCVALIRSPISGEHGNRELLAHFVRVEHATQCDSNPADAAEWEGVAGDMRWQRHAQMLLES